MYGAVSEDEMQVEQDQFIAAMLRVLGASIVISLLIAFYLSRTLVNVTRVIQHALEKVQKGDLTTRILSYDFAGSVFRKRKEMNPHGNELEQIALSFNDTVARFSEMLRENRQLQLTSETDHLTGLPNLRSFEQMVKDYHELNPLETRAMIVLDLDHFKSINDTYGHEAGNEILRQFADLLRDFVKREGEIARFGGEEFILLLPNYGIDEAVVFAEKLRQTILKEPFVCHNYLSQEKEECWLDLTASIGVAAYPNEVEVDAKAEELISHADRAMYLGSKRNGRNKVTAYTSEL